MKRLKIEEELGIVLAHLGEYKESSRMMMSVLATKEKMYGADSPELCNCLDGLAHNAHQLQQFEEAAVFANRSLQLTAIASSNDRIARLQNLAAVENGRGLPEVAIALCEQALHLASKTFGSFHPIVAQADGNLGYLKYSNGDAEAALTHYIRVLKYYDETFGAQHRVRWAIVNGIAMSLAQTNRLAESLSFCKQGLDLAIDHFGIDHINTITAAITYAYCLVQTGHLASAYEMYQEWLPRKQAILGYNHPSTVRSIDHFNVLSARMSRGREEDDAPSSHS
jgi:tetratricopeptide (TPR) repeat protein